MVSINNFFNNPNIKVVAQAGNIKVMEYQKDYTMNPMEAPSLFYCDKMGVRKKQVVIELKNTSCILSAGAMQWLLGAVQAQTDVKGVGDFFVRVVKAAASG